MGFKIGDKVKIIEPANVNDDYEPSTQINEYATVWGIRDDSAFTIGVRLDKDSLSPKLRLWWFAGDELELVERNDE